MILRPLDLSPTSENIFAAYEQDLLKRNSQVHRLVDLLNAIDDNTVLAIDGEWGSGKTFFVKQCQMVINALNTVISPEQDEQVNKIRNNWAQIHPEDEGVTISQYAIYYDAWANDCDEDRKR